MKKSQLLIHLLIIITLVIILSSLVSPLSLSNDNFAVEVILKDYNIKKIDNLANVTVLGNSFIFQSQHSPNLYTIISEDSKNKEISIRLQLPTKIGDVSIPYVRFVSNIKQPNLNFSEISYYNEWQISCISQTCNLKSQDAGVVAEQVSRDSFEISIDSYSGISGIQPRLRCFSRQGETNCLTNQFRQELEDVFRKIGLVASFDELFNSYNLIGLGEKTTSTIYSEFGTGTNWQSAVRAELNFLNENGIILLKNQDMDSIASLASQGRAGNSRIIYDKENANYYYYYQIKNPALNFNNNQQSQPFTAPITGSIVAGKNLNPYYLIPVVLTAILLVVFVILIITAKIITRERKSKLKPVTGLQNQG